MSNSKHGLCLIINNEEYKSSSTNRKGSEKDVEKLELLFQQLRFKVLKKFNLTKIDMNKVLDDFANDKRHERAEMSVVVILAHGDQGLIECVDGYHVRFFLPRRLITISHDKDLN